jgi:hypothetical protein
MTLDELEEACAEAEADGFTDVQLHVPWIATGRNVRLAGRCGPMSNECHYTGHGTMGLWDIGKVRRFIKRARKATS